MDRKWFFTSESVTEGHPDKICDKISDGVLDALLAQDPYARVACETTVTTGMIHLMGEISTTAQVDFATIFFFERCDQFVRDVLLPHIDVQFCACFSISSSIS